MSKNEFIELVITHYQDLLEAEQNKTLPAAIQSAIDGRLTLNFGRGAKKEDRRGAQAGRSRKQRTDNVDVKTSW